MGWLACIMGVSPHDRPIARVKHPPGFAQLGRRFRGSALGIGLKYVDGGSELIRVVLQQVAAKIQRRQSRFQTERKAFWSFSGKSILPRNSKAKPQDERLM
jgi:hypothetical protein